MCAGMGSFVLRRRVHDLSPTGIISRLRARDGAFRAPARVTFFFCKKKVTKENHSNLRFKDPLARGGQVRIWRCVLAGGVQRSSLSVKRTVPAFTGAEAGAAACLSYGRGVFFCRVGDYQIAPIAARSTAMGRWRLTPPGYGGTCLPAGRSVRGSDRPPACHSIPRTPQGEGFFRPGALLLALFISFCLFISFWWRRSGRSETGATGRRRGLRRGQRSWANPWCRRP